MDRRYPPIWQLLSRHGVRVGLFGSLHTHPLPADVASYAFYVPDTFAPSPECFPPALVPYQRFNLAMARASARNVDPRLQGRAALGFLASAWQVGLRPRTAFSLAAQLIQERVRPARRVWRRTYQAVLSFDIFLKCLRQTQPDFAMVFTNHVASAMHRYWAAAFPQDYASFGYDAEWVLTYRDEIRFAMDEADRFIGDLVRFAHAHPGHEIWIASSMGQAARSAEPAHTQLYVVEPERFMHALGLARHQWQARPAMVPQFNFQVGPALARPVEESLGALRIGDQPVRFRAASEGVFSVDFGQVDLDLRHVPITLRESPVDTGAVGLANVAIEDLSSSTAYHVPAGTLLIWAPRGGDAAPGPARLSTLEIAPMLLRNYGVPVPDYMTAPTAMGSLAEATPPAAVS